MQVHITFQLFRSNFSKEEKSLSLQSSLSQKQVLGQKPLIRQNKYKACVAYKRQAIWKNKWLDFIQGISFIVHYLPANMFNCTSSVSLAHNHRLCSCYVEPYSDPICLSIHFPTEWHHIRAIRFSNSLLKHNCYLWYGLKRGQMSMATSAVIGLLRNSAACIKTGYVNNENNIINVRAHVLKKHLES